MMKINFNPNVESSEVTTQDAEYLQDPSPLVFSRLGHEKSTQNTTWWSIHKSGYLNNDATTTATEH